MLHLSSRKAADGAIETPLFAATCDARDAIPASIQHGARYCTVSVTKKKALRRQPRPVASDRAATASQRLCCGPSSDQIRNDDSGLLDPVLGTLAYDVICTRRAATLVGVMCCIVPTTFESFSLRCIWTATTRLEQRRSSDSHSIPGVLPNRGGLFCETCLCGSGRVE